MPLIFQAMQYLSLLSSDGMVQKKWYPSMNQKVEWTWFPRGWTWSKESSLLTSELTADPKASKSSRKL